jgi:thiosulfate dehydrogenase [quinone] large subunit
VVIGWYFLYEGLSKLMASGWTARVYLLNSRWVFAGIFHQMAENQTIMKLVDFLNIWGLILIGLSLFIGLLVRWASIAGMFMLLFYFVAYPPIPGYTFGTVAEGSYIWVNKNLILLFILPVFIVLKAENWYSIDRLIKSWKKEKPEAPILAITNKGVFFQRREVLRDLISFPLLGAFAYGFTEKLNPIL